MGMRMGVVVKYLDGSIGSLCKVPFGMVVDTLATIPNGSDSDWFYAVDSLALTD